MGQGGHATFLGRWRSSAALNGFPSSEPAGLNGMTEIPLKYHKFNVVSHLSLTLMCYITLELLDGFAAFAQLAGIQPIERMEVAISGQYSVAGDS